MSHKAAKVGATTLVLLTAFGILMYSTLGESMQYYKYVDEVMVDQQAWHGKKLQVHGYASAVARKPNTLEYQFNLERNGQVMRAYYTGIVPDTFKNDAEVVLTGELTPQGFMATEMTAKCPSKYEERPGALTPGS